MLILGISAIILVALQPSQQEGRVLDHRESGFNNSYDDFGEDTGDFKSNAPESNAILEEINENVKLILAENGQINENLKQVIENSNYTWKRIDENFEAVNSNIKENTGFLRQILNRMSSQATVQAKDCSDLYRYGHRQNGVYRVFPVFPFVALIVYCDMETEGGGWTVFQRRGDFNFPYDYFFKSWKEYRDGFGEPAKEYWLGNENLFRLTRQKPYRLRIDLWDLEGEHKVAKYSAFRIHDEDSMYKLSIGDYSGTAGNSLSYHNQMPFSAKDRDHSPSLTCAQRWQSGWWFGKGHCFEVNLNGLNLRELNEKDWKGVVWNRWKNGISLAFVEMKIRPVSF